MVSALVPRARTYLLLMLLFLSACNTTAPRAKSHENGRYRRIRQEFFSVLDEGLIKRYNRADSPCLAVIKGFYHLPKESPLGAAQIQKHYSYSTHLHHTIQTEDEETTFTIDPWPLKLRLEFDEAFKRLKDVGICLEVLDERQAMAVAQSEKKALEQDLLFSELSSIKPGFDHLVSFHRLRYERGSILTGRVVDRKGRLMAFRALTTRELMGHMNSSLLTSLLEDTIARR